MISPITSIITFLTSLLFLLLLFYKLGKKDKEQEVINNNNKLKKQYENNQIKDIKTIEENLRKGSFIFILILLTSCSNKVISTACPSIEFYDLEFQNNLANDLNKANSYYLNKAILDYGNLRYKIRVCNGNS